MNASETIFAVYQTRDDETALRYVQFLTRAKLDECIDELPAGTTVHKVPQVLVDDVSNSNDWDALWAVLEAQRATNFCIRL